MNVQFKFFILFITVCLKFRIACSLVIDEVVATRMNKLLSFRSMCILMLLHTIRNIDYLIT